VADAPDEPRYLGRSIGYARFPTVDPVEAVSAHEQEQQTRAARERWRRETQRAWGEARTSILDGVSRFKASGRLDRQLVSDLHLVERGVAAIDRDVLET
jgi:uncharacterized protein involved in type VI secretion and phage assembly